MQLPYSQLKGRLKVGDRVRAVPGKYSCFKSREDGAVITEISEDSFRVNGCIHYFDRKDNWLEIIEDRAIVRGGWECGTILVHKGTGIKKIVVAMMAQVHCLVDFPSRLKASWHSDEDLIENFLLDLPEPPKPEPKMVMLTPEQAEKVKEIIEQDKMFGTIKEEGLQPSLFRERLRRLQEAIDAITDKSGDVGRE